VKDLKMNWAADKATYLQCLALWIILSNHIKETGRALPHIRKIIPAIIDFWNRTKGGVDVFSRLLASKPPIHGGMNLLGTYTLRCIMTLLVNAHLVSRSFQLFDESDTPIRERFKTLSEFKNRLNSIRSLPTFLRQGNLSDLMLLL
jgi:hypothetical protein